MRLGIKRGVTTALFILFSGALLTGCGVHFTIGSGTHMLHKEDAKEFSVEKTDVDAISLIDIQTDYAKVELIPSDSFSVEIDYLYWEDEPEYSIKDGKLKFDDSDCFPEAISINFDLENTIKVYLPSNANLDHLLVSDACGDVDLSSFVAKEMDIKVAYGDLTIEKAAAAEAEITLSCGYSKITDFQVGNLDFKNSYGDADFTNINTGDALLPANVSYDKFDISMSSGDVTMKALNCDCISIDNSYGNITCQEVISGDFDSELSSGDFEVTKSDLKDVNVDNSYGDVELDLIGSAKDYSLELSTSYGNIKVGDKSYEEEFNQDNDGAKKITADLSSGDIDINFKGGL